MKLLINLTSDTALGRSDDDHRHAYLFGFNRDGLDAHSTRNL